MSDLPSKDWINFMNVFEETDTAIKTNHMKATIQDPYVAEKDLDGFIHGWFTNTMPDLNVRNPFLATYLIQNSIWWVEYADLQGIRMDTYPYPDKEYMTDWTCALMEEYPNFNIVGEEWHTDPAIVSFWQRGKGNANAYTSCLPSLMDFPIQADLVKSLNADEDGWASGWKDVYETLAKDFLYPDPFNLVIFPDNHDMSRIYTQLNEDFDLYRLAIAYYTVLRGIPQFYYGTEILMGNPNSDDHGEIRSDFPGGWDGDEINGFTGEGLSAKEKEAQEFVKTLLNWRKQSEAVHSGRLMHYSPEKNSVYVIFRYTESDKVMTILSKNDKDVKLDLSRFTEMLRGDEKGVDIVSGRKINLADGLIIPAKSPMIIDFE
jgi:glycosidase